MPGVLGDGETSDRKLEHAGGMERRGEVHGEEGGESRSSLEFHGIAVVEFLESPDYGVLVR